MYSISLESPEQPNTGVSSQKRDSTFKNMFFDLKVTIFCFIHLFVNLVFFQRFILFCILTNTFSMGIEYHSQPEWLTKTVEISNLAFSMIFAVEMILKLMALGFFQYIADGFNVFDGVIVILRYN